MKRHVSEGTGEQVQEIKRPKAGGELRVSIVPGAWRGLQRGTCKLSVRQREMVLQNIQAISRETHFCNALFDHFLTPFDGFVDYFSFKHLESLTL